jgi:hypothetical protein
MSTSLSTILLHGTLVYNLSQLLEREGLKPMTHGNTGKTPKHALSMTDIQRVKHFLNEYAVKFVTMSPWL